MKQAFVFVYPSGIEVKKSITAKQAFVHWKKLYANGELSRFYPIASTKLPAHRIVRSLMRLR